MADGAWSGWGDEALGWHGALRLPRVQGRDISRGHADDRPWKGNSRVVRGRGQGWKGNPRVVRDYGRWRKAFSRVVRSLREPMGSQVGFFLSATGVDFAQLGNFLSRVGHRHAQLVLFLSRVEHHRSQLGIFLSGPHPDSTQVGLFLSRVGHRHAQLGNFFSSKGAGPHKSAGSFPVRGLRLRRAGLSVRQPRRLRISGQHEGGAEPPQTPPRLFDTLWRSPFVDAPMRARPYDQPLSSEPKSLMSSTARVTMASKPGLRSLRGS